MPSVREVEMVHRDPDTIDNWPVCPKCGCDALNWVGEKIHGGVVFDRLECDYCGYQRLVADAKQAETAFDSEPDREVVLVKRLRCPIERCRSRRIHVYKTIGPREHGRGAGIVVRYHRCLTCDFRFKSTEQL